MQVYVPGMRSKALMHLMQCVRCGASVSDAGVCAWDAQQGADAPDAVCALRGFCV
jgi:hypothetical protein